MSVAMNPLDLFFKNKFTEHGINPFTKTYMKKRELVNKKIMTQFRKLESMSHVDSNNILGGLVNYNKNNPK